MMDGKNSATDLEELLQHTGWIRNLAAANLRDYELAEDVSQEVLARALTGPRPSGKVLRSWLAAVTCNMARNEIRGRSRRRAREEKVARPEGNERDAEQQEMLVAVQQIAAAVKALSMEHRSVVVLRFFEERSFREISEELGITENNARVRLHRALHELRSALQAQHSDWRACCLALAPAAVTPAPSLNSVPPGKVLGLVSAAGILGVALWWGGYFRNAGTDVAPATEAPSVEAQVAWKDNEIDLEIRRQDKLRTAAVIDGPNEEAIAYQPLNGRVFRDWLPVAGADVRIWQAGALHSTTTDSTGHFTFSIDPNEHANVTVQANGEGRMASWHVGRPREMIFDLWAAPAEGLDVHVYADSSEVGIPNATVQLYLDYSGFDRGTSSQAESLQLVAEGVTNNEGVFQAPGWLADMHVVVSAQADGYLPNHGVPRGGSTRYPEVHLLSGEQLPVQLVFADGTPVANAQLLEGFRIRRNISTDNDGFLSSVLEWDKATHTNAISALPRQLMMVLPDGRIWSQGARTFKEDFVSVLPDRLQLTVETSPIQVQLDDVVLPENSWLEARCTYFSSHAWMAEDVESMWQIVAPEGITTLEQGWVGGGVGMVRTRLMPGGTFFGKFPIVDGLAVIKGQVGHLKLTLQGSAVLEGREFEAVIQRDGLHKKLRVPFIDGVAEIDLGIEPGDITTGAVEERFSGVKQNLQNAQGNSVKGFFLQADSWMEQQLVLMPSVTRDVQIRVNGIPVTGGTADDVVINANGVCAIPFNLDGTLNIDSLLLRLPAEVHQQPGGPILSSLFFTEGSEVSGIIQQNSTGPWFWDFELAQVELMVPPSEVTWRRKVFVKKGPLRSIIPWPGQRPEGQSGSVTSPPQGGWCAFRVPSGTYAFQVRDTMFGGEEGVDCVTGATTQLYPDDDSVVD